MRFGRFRARLKWISGGVLALTIASGVGIATAAGPDDRAATEAVLHEVESSPKKNVAAEMTARSRAALERAAQLRASGDEPHARLADGLAKTWADAARDVVRAVAVEEKAQSTRLAANDAGVVAERERALLEEGVAQSGRLEAQLDAAERASSEQPARTSAAASGQTDGGASKPKVAPKPPKPPAAPRDVAPKAPTAPRPPAAPKAPAAPRDGGAR